MSEPTGFYTGLTTGELASLIAYYARHDNGDKSQKLTGSVEWFVEGGEMWAISTVRDEEGEPIAHRETRLCSDEWDAIDGPEGSGRDQYLPDGFFSIAGDNVELNERTEYFIVDRV